MDAPSDKLASERREAFSWLSDWEYPHESSLSLILKFAWANCVQAKDICPVLFGTPSLNNQNAGTHGRTLLDAKWMMRSRSSLRSAMAHKIAAGTLSALAGRWTHKIAADSAIRYCPECLFRGFHSPVFQIDGIGQCPIHRTPLSVTCPRCGAATARYAVAPEGVDTPFHCSKCLAPLAGSCNPHNWCDDRLRSAAEEILGPMIRWLRTLERSSLTWEQWESWFMPLQSQSVESERRADTLAVLLDLIPPSFDIHVFGVARPTPRIYLGRTDGTDTRHFTALPVCLPAAEVAARTAIYKSLRRHAARTLAGCKRASIARLDSCIQINHSDEVMYPSMRLCPRVQALTLWRLHFETLEGRGNGLTLRQAALNWPWKGQADLRGWAGYALASLHAAIDAFDVWRHRASNLPDAELQGTDRIRARELFTEFAPLLSPTRLATFPAISILKFQDVAQDFNLAIVGPPLTGVNPLLPCTPGPWCACAHRYRTPGDGSASAPPNRTAAIVAQGVQRTHDDHVATEYITPLDKLKLPASLDGSCFQLERKQAGCTLAAENDIAAISLWLDACTERSSTRRAYQLCAEKCLIWAVAQRGKPLSAFDQIDAKAYAEFLLDPQPREVWLHGGGASRSKLNWTPFKKPLATRSRDYSIRLLALLFKYWRASNYIWSNPWSQLPFAFDGTARRELAPMTVVERDANFVTLAEWHFLLKATRQGEDDEWAAAMHAVLYLAYYAALKPHEIGELRLADLGIEKRGPGDRNLWSVTVRSRPQARRRIFLFPCVVERLVRFLPDDAQALELVRRRDGALPFIDLIGSPFSSAGRDIEPGCDTRQYLYVPTKPVFKAAATLASNAGDEVAAGRLSRASIGWLSASLAVHVRQLDLSELALWHVLGVATLVSPAMRSYLPENREQLDRPVAESMSALSTVVPN